MGGICGCYKSSPNGVSMQTPHRLAWKCESVEDASAIEQSQTTNIAMVGWELLVMQILWNRQRLLQFSLSQVEWGRDSLKVWLHMCNSCMQFLQRSARIADRSKVKENIDWQCYKPRRPESKITACKNCTCNQTFIRSKLWAQNATNSFND